jgi:hypothetical protein
MFVSVKERERHPSDPVLISLEITKSLDFNFSGIFREPNLIADQLSLRISNLISVMSLLIWYSIGIFWNNKNN